MVGTAGLNPKGHFPPAFRVVPALCCAVPATHKEIKVVFLKHLKEQGAVLLCHHKFYFLLNREILFYDHNNPKTLQGSSEEFV